MITLSLVELSKKVDKLARTICCISNDSTFDELTVGELTVTGTENVVQVNANNIYISNALLDASGNFIASFYPYQASPQNITAGTGGAINLTSFYTSINTDAGGDAYTLAAGTVIGQRKRIRMVVDGGGDGVVTVTGGAGFTTITFNDAGDDVELMHTGLGWLVMVNIGATIV